MKRPLCLAAAAVLLAACAQRPVRSRQPEDVGDLENAPLHPGAPAAGVPGLTDLDRALKEMEKSSKDLAAVQQKLDGMCLGYAMHAFYALDRARGGQDEELAFKDYYMALLDVKGETQYVACLKRRWRVPLLHAEYRRGRRWLKIAQGNAARYEPWISPDKRIADVSEDFTSSGSSTTLHRVDITFARGGKLALEEIIDTPAELRSLYPHLNDPVSPVMHPVPDR